MPTWDSEKGAGDGVSSEQWNNHVDDQKSRAKNIVQTEEPPVGAPGDLWTKPVRIFEKGAGSAVPSDISSAGSLQMDGDILYIFDGQSGGEFYSNDLIDGSENWATGYGIGGDSAEVAHYSDGTIYVAGDDGYNIDVVWEYDVDSDSMGWSHEIHTKGSYSTDINDIQASNGSVYTCSADQTVVSVSASDGSEEWTHSLHTSEVYAMDVVDGVVYSGSGDGTLIAADAADGAELWRKSLSSDTIYVHVSDGIAYVGSGDAYALDASTGDELWQTEYTTLRISQVNKSGETVNFLAYNPNSTGYEMVGVDADTGMKYWKYTHANLGAPLLTNDQSIYFGFDGDIHKGESHPRASTSVSDGDSWVEQR